MITGFWGWISAGVAVAIALLIVGIAFAILWALFNGTMTDASILPAFGLMIVMAALFIFWASRMFRTATS